MRDGPPTIQADLTFLAAHEGGRKTLPDFVSGQYMPHLVVLDAADVEEEYLSVRFLDGPSNYTFGESGRFLLELMYHPRVDYTRLRRGSELAVREGGRTVARGYAVSGFQEN